MGKGLGTGNFDCHWKRRVKSRGAGNLALQPITNGSLKRACYKRSLSCRERGVSPNTGLSLHPFRKMGCVFIHPAQPRTPSFGGVLPRSLRYWVLFLYPGDPSGSAPFRRGHTPQAGDTRPYFYTPGTLEGDIVLQPTQGIYNVEGTCKKSLNLAHL